MTKLVTMFSDVVRSLFHRPVTELYPFEKTEAPERMRGKLEWDRETCTGCGLCVTDCPAFALHLTVLDRKAKRFTMDYNVDCCIFCGQCMQSCRSGSITMPSTQWELAALSRQPFLYHYGDAQDVEQVLAGKSESKAEAA
jgi:formate hydrogenlyase subunit 6/NADH:ubiquinone oxidoreductase subunit I